MTAAPTLGRLDGGGPARLPATHVSACRAGPFVTQGSLMDSILPEAKGHAFITERDQLVATQLIEEIERLRAALSEIARGRTDNGRALGGETARQIARQAMTDMGHSWSDSVPPGEAS